MAIRDPQYPNEVAARQKAEVSAITRAHLPAGTPPRKRTLKEMVAARRAERDRTAHKPLRPNTIDHFRAYTKLLVLDSGDYWEIESFQCEVVDEVFNGVLETWAVIPEANAKCLDVKTPLPTPDGWTTMLNVKTGDWLLGSDGQPVLVGAVSEIKLGLPCYEITFSDGSTVVSDSEHLWAVEDAQNHYKPEVRSIADLISKPLKLRKSNGSTVARWRVPTAARQGQEIELPVDPYVLGVWLGDGASDCGRITNVDEAVWEEIEDVYEVGPVASLTRARTHTVYGLQQKLRDLGVLGAKHIPESYLIASESQRQALLQGLMDSDGTISKSGQATYNTTDKRLASDVRRLAWSLGHPCSWNERPAFLYGVECGTSYKLCISCDVHQPVVRLPRKAERLKQHGTTARHRRIVDIKPVRSRPVKCVQVHSDDNLYLAGEALIPTHNTTLTAGLALYHADYVADASVCMAAASRDQTGVLFYQAAGFIWRTPHMEKRFIIRDAQRIIDATRSKGRIKVYSADARTGDGVIPTLAILEELHRQKTLGLYRVWYGKLDKRGGQLLAISTAGDPASEFEIIREKLLVSATKTTIVDFHTRAEHESTVIHDWRVPEDADVNDPAVLKRANPLKAVTEAKLLAKIKSPTMTTAHIRRFAANQPTRGMETAVNPLEWRDAGTDDRIPANEPVAVGLDLGWKWDTTGIVPIWLPDLENRLIDYVNIIEPPRDGSTLSPTVVKNAFWTIHRRNPIEMVVMDEDRGAEIAEFLRNEIGAKVVGHSQSDPAMCLAYDRWMEALRNGWLRWSRKGDDAQTLTAHINNAVTKLLPSGKARFERPSQGVRQGRNPNSNERNVIDGLIAACMVNSVAAANTGQQSLLDPSEFRVDAA